VSRRSVTIVNCTLEAHLLTYSLADLYVIDGLMQLLQDFAAAYQALTQFECQRAIELFGLLPARHYNTGWVLCNVARAYFELCDYRQVI